MVFKEQPKIKKCKTVGNLMDELAKLPKTLPIKQGFGIGVNPTVFNSKTSAFLEFVEVED